MLRFRKTVPVQLTALSKVNQPGFVMSGEVYTGRGLIDPRQSEGRLEGMRVHIWCRARVEGQNLCIVSYVPAVSAVPSVLPRACVDAGQISSCDILTKF